MTIFTFYSLTSLSSLIVILIMALCVPVFILCGIATPLFGAFKLVDAILNLGIPYARYIGISGIESPALVFILSIIVGVALYHVHAGNC